MNTHPSLHVYIKEALDHLSTIEDDLKNIEAAGIHTEVELITKVYKGVHAIKGGAGFFNLTNIQRLSHRIENVLDLIRFQQILPTGECIDTLLKAFNCLRTMIQHYEDSNETQIEELLQMLTDVAVSCLPESEARSMVTQVPITGPNKKEPAIVVSEYDLNQVRREGKFVYLIEVDLLHDIHAKGKSPWEIFKELMTYGTILECKWDFSAVGTLDDDAANSIPFQILYATTMDESVIKSCINIPDQRIHSITWEGPAL